MTAVLYTNYIVDELIRSEQKKIDFYADLYRKLLDPVEVENILESSTDNYEESTSGADRFQLLIDLAASTISFPIIITDERDSAFYPYEQWSLNLELDSNHSLQKQREYVQEYVERMKGNYHPIEVKTRDSTILFKMYYTHTELLDNLQLFPLIEVGIVAVFIIIGYLAFSNIRRNQESKVWVGMSKEAAHQMGTPLSSLLAWVEILKFNNEQPVPLEETISEMENDLNRLNIIATRFGKIGEKPDLKPENLAEHLENVCKYFDKRLPHIGKKISIERSLHNNTTGMINSELFAWVFENLLKNGAEAIESKEGKLSVILNGQKDKKIIIYVKDTGKGMSAKQKRQVFHPGFTTKKRGWGLGLSLSKRIIEQYHHGKIYVKDSNPGQGTTFAIELPSEIEEEL